MTDAIGETRAALVKSLYPLTPWAREVLRRADRYALAGFDAGVGSSGCGGVFAPCVHRGGTRVCRMALHARLEPQPC